MLIIFDCDGVLVDSEMIASRELAAYLTNLGRPTLGEECRENFTGLSIKGVGEKVAREWGLKTRDDFGASLRARDFGAFERDLVAIPGVEAVLDTLDQKGLPYCVASSGSPEKIRHSLTLTNLLERFNGNVFSAVQVVNGKPAPDLFLLAAQTMGAAPDEWRGHRGRPLWGRGGQGGRHAGAGLYRRFALRSSPCGEA